METFEFVAINLKTEKVVQTAERTLEWYQKIHKHQKEKKSVLVEEWKPNPEKYKTVFVKGVPTHILLKDEEPPNTDEEPPKSKSKPKPKN